MINLKDTTAFSTIAEDGHVLLSGDEKWPIIGDLVSHEIILESLKKFSGMRKYWDCLAKAQTVSRVLLSCDNKIGNGVGRPIVVLGSCFVWSGDWKSSFGYAWNPPYEFHTWVEFNGIDGVLDLALPGVIEKGLRSRDSVGYYLLNREPVIINGKPPRWVEYKREEVIGRKNG